MKQVIQQGAEAILYKEKDIVIKDRIKKGYRLEEIDRKIRKLRTRGEAKLLNAAIRSGITVPRVLESEENIIKIEFIDGEKIKDIFNNISEKERKVVSELIGEAAGKLHSAGIAHGDLTTSNMILKEEPYTLYIIANLTP